MSGLRLKSAGPFSTLQDAGRFGWLRFGVATAGAFDAAYFAIANRLVGNPPDTAVIEMTLRGDSYEVTATSCRVALAGDFTCSIDGSTCEAWRSHRLLQGQVLKIGGARSGLRGYLAVEGGFAVAPTLGSLSTHVRTGIGGLAGSTLKAGMMLPLAQPAAIERAERSIDPSSLPERAGPIRVLLGPQDDLFTRRGIETFIGSRYEISGEADRMGYRLLGPTIEHARGYNIISDGIPLGAIQVPGSGTPIVLLPDRQTTGGYPKIATVVTPDVWRLAQARPGDILQFAAVGIAEAHALLARHRQRLADLPIIEDGERR